MVLSTKFALAYLFMLLPVMGILERATKADTGVASYYSHKFHGRRTASGHMFHTDSMTTAPMSVCLLVRISKLPT